jgi:site-specific DNA-adenine methylase
MALIRYPGSKAKIAPELLRRFPADMLGPLFHDGDPVEYREPFFGAGAVGFEALSWISGKCSVWINDIDPSMRALWMAVAWNPWELCQRIDALKPSPQLFYELKEEDGRTDLPTSEMAVRKLALHRLSYSGLGVMSGGPLGGKNSTASCRDFPHLKSRHWISAS